MPSSPDGRKNLGETMLTTAQTLQSPHVSRGHTSAPTAKKRSRHEPTPGLIKAEREPSPKRYRRGYEYGEVRQDGQNLTRHRQQRRAHGERQPQQQTTGSHADDRRDVRLPDERDRRPSRRGGAPRGRRTRRELEEDRRAPRQGYVRHGEERQWQPRPRRMAGHRRDIIIGYRKLEEWSEGEADTVIVDINANLKPFIEVLNSDLRQKPDWILLVLKCLSHSLAITQRPENRTNLIKNVIKSDFLPRTMQPLITNIALKLDKTGPPAAERELECAVHFIDMLDTMLRCSNSVFDRISRSVAVAESLSLRLKPAQNQAQVRDILEAGRELIVLRDNILKDRQEEIKKKEMVGFQPKESIKDCPIHPMEEELRFGLTSDLLPLKNVYANQEEYLYTQFHLLREDFVRPLVSGLREYLNCSDASRLKSFTDQNARLFRRVQCTDFACTISHGIRFQLDFNDSPQYRKFRGPKRLVPGSLLLASSDGFLSEILPLVVADRRDFDKGTCPVAIPLSSQFQGEQANLLLNTKFDVLESVAFYEGVRPVLLTLQQLSKQAELERQEFTLPLPLSIIYADTETQPPAYLREEEGDAKDLYVDFRPVITPAARLCGQYKAVPILSGTWPPASSIAFNDGVTGVDEAQYQALRYALTREFAVIQGPPGTGKTFLGLILMKLLLSNRHLWTEDTTRHKCAPILLVCYTNHALDHFLEGLIKLDMVRPGRNDLIRVGGGSKSEKIQPYLLHEYKQKLKKAEAMETNRLRMECYRRQDEIAVHREDYGAAQWCIIYERRLFRDEHTDHIQRALVSMGPQGPFGISAIAQWLDIFETRSGDDFSQYDNTNDLAGEAELIFQDDDDLYGDGNRIWYESDDDSSADDRNSGTRDKRSARSDIDIRQLEGHDAVKKWDPEYLQKHERYLRRQIQNTSDVMTDEEVAALLEGGGDPYRLRHYDRWRLYRKWRDQFCRRISTRVKELLPEYLRAVQMFKESVVDQDVDLFNEMKVIGMTTTGAAKYSSVLRLVGPKIILVEEAAEILESQVVAALGRHCQHLIQIGDHQQLRPSTNVYQLSNKFKLDISLFERAINAGMPHSSLRTQHRMRPEISGLLVPTIYPRLDDHDSVKQRPPISGVNKDVFFLNHNVSEDNDSESFSHSNKHEATFLARLCQYLVQQGYAEAEITILTTYSKQIVTVREELVKGSRKLEVVRVTTVDNYQGEENRIILLSLVRCNEEEKIGFLSSENRICVALSRAKEGFYAIGNLDLFQKKSNTWSKILDKAKCQGFVGNKLVLKCHNHPEMATEVGRAPDFDTVKGGGCQRPCLVRLKCGHPCKHTCHTEDRDHETGQYTFCNRPCNKICTNQHRCQKKCWECTKGCQCDVKMDKLIPKCGHTEKMQCHINPAEFECTHPCTVELQCGHIYPYKCCKTCIAPVECTCPVQAVLPCGHEKKIKCYESHSLDTIPCSTRCKATLPCGHGQVIKCYESHTLDTIPCSTRCKATLPCGHTCPGTCSVCLQGLHQPCQTGCERTLICQHQCPEPCTQACPPCKRPCEVGCDHSQCPDPCGQPCEPCREPCSWRCSHFRCEKLCHEKCDRPRCNKPCQRIVNVETCQCRRRCIGICGEPCPTICKEHESETLREIDDMYSLHDDESHNDAIYLQLDCNHVFESGWLDTFMEGAVDNPRDGQEEDTSVQQVCCPLCRAPITRLTGRYGNILKQFQANMDKVKTRVQNERLMDNVVLTREQRRLRQVLRSGFGQSADQDTGMYETLREHIQQIRTREDVVQVENRIGMSKTVKEFRADLSRAVFSFPYRPFDKSGIKADFLSVAKWLSNQKVTKSYQASAFSAEFDKLGLRLKLYVIVQALKSTERDVVQTADSDADCEAIDELLTKVCVGKERQKEVPEETVEEMEKLVAKHKTILSTMTESERRGHRYNCRGIPIYITEDGGATEIAQCSECGPGIGGTNHRLREDNRVATEMDEAR